MELVENLLEVPLHLFPFILLLFAWLHRLLNLEWELFYTLSEQWIREHDHCLLVLLNALQDLDSSVRLLQNQSVLVLDVAGDSLLQKEVSHVVAKVVHVV